MRQLGKYKVNYQNQFLYISEHAVAPHFTDESMSDPDNSRRNRPWTNAAGNKLRPLIRVQSLNYGSKTNFIPVNQFGQASRVDFASLNTPDIYFNFEYLLLDGFNESSANFIIDGIQPALSRYLTNDFKLGKNIFLVVGPPNYDLINQDLLSIEDDISVVGIGNSFLTQYAITAEVGSLPKARMSFEGFNIRSYKGVSNLTVPSIDPIEDCADLDYKFSLPDIGDTLSYESIGDVYNQIELKEHSRTVTPGTIKVSLDDGGIITQQNKEDFLVGQGTANIQGFSVNIPLGVTRMSRMGHNFEFSRSYNFPSKMDITFTALVSELKESDLFSELCKNKKHNLVISMHDFCSVTTCGGKLKQEDAHVAFYFKGALLDSESLSSSIESSAKSVEVTFSLPMSDPHTNLDEGFFMFGKSFFPEIPKIIAWGNPL